MLRAVVEMDPGGSNVMYVGAAFAETANPKLATVKPISSGRLNRTGVAEARAANARGTGC